MAAWSLTLALCVVLGLFVYQVTRTALALRQVKADAAVLTTQAKAGDVERAKSTLRALAAQAHTARSHSDNLLWSAASALPWIGQDVEAVRVASHALDSASRSTLPVALQLYESLKGDRLRSNDGRIDTAQVAKLAPGFKALLAGATEADDDLSAVRANELRLGAVRTATLQFQTRLDSLLTLARAGSTASRVLPPMMGGDGPRTYLLVVQNNAEVRSTGGLAGTFTEIKVKGGRLSMGRQLSDRDFPELESPIIPLTPDERALHTDQIAKNITAVTATPDFPRAAQIIDARYRATFGKQVDGVISVDPVALSFLLRATGPVQAAGQTYTADNVVSELLNQTYLRISDPAEQDEHFADAAKGIFDALSSRPVSQSALVSEFARMVDQHRFLVWSRHAAERKALAGTQVSGELARGEAAATRAGMYLNGAVGTKMQYYLNYAGHVGDASCTKAGEQKFAAQLKLRSNAPRGGKGLPPYITGRLGPDRPAKGDQLVRLFIFGPAAGHVDSLEANGGPQRLVLFEYNGRPVAFVNLLLHPGQEISIIARLRTAPGAKGDPTFEWTPGIRASPSSATVDTACR